MNNNLFEFDNSFDADCLIGTDEAGRGPGAGGVFASAVCFNNADKNLIKKLSGLNDSKKLSKKKREELYDIILENTINSTVCIEVEEIEKINILNASLKAMRLACENVIELCPPLEGGPKSIDFEGGIKNKSNILILVDGNKLIKDICPPLNFSDARSSHRKILTSRKTILNRFARQSPSSGEDVLLHASPFTLHSSIKQQCIIKGDGKSASIAAASILAKVSRDGYMQELDKKFPQYNWKQNAGYLTKEHLNAIEKHGITPYHRKSFLKRFKPKQLSLI